MRMKFIDYENFIYLHPSLVCNFDCVYCGQHNNQRESLKELEIVKIIQRLDKFKKTFLVSICGGEPFLIPNLIDFVFELTKNHYVRIDTNLSLTENIRKFASIINPNKVTEIVFSVHILEREKRQLDLQELISLAKELRGKGFKIIGNYVVYPPLINRLEKDMNFFNSQGIKVLPILFVGTYNGRQYPLHKGIPSYSKAEIELIARFNPYSTIPLYSPRNDFCQAGCSIFCVNDRFEVFPCLTMQKCKESKLGDFFGKWKIFPKVIRCPKDYCTDQYNKTFVCSLDRFNMSYLQLKAISEKGICSPLQSFIYLRQHWGKKLLRKAKMAIQFLLYKISPKEKVDKIVYNLESKIRKII